MPNYGVPQAGGVLTQINPGDDYTLFKNESPAAPQASVAFCRGVGEGLQPSKMVFTIAAAAGTVTIEGSNDDVDANYQTLNTTTSLAHDYYVDEGVFLFYRAKLTAGVGPITVSVQR